MADKVEIEAIQKATRNEELDPERTRVGIQGVMDKIRTQDFYGCSIEGAFLIDGDKAAMYRFGVVIKNYGPPLDEYDTMKESKRGIGVWKDGLQLSRDEFAWWLNEWAEERAVEFREQFLVWNRLSKTTGLCDDLIRLVGEHFDPRFLPLFRKMQRGKELVEVDAHDGW